MSKVPLPVPGRLLSPVPFGHFVLANRIVMAPLTRSRADAGGVPSPHAVTYYGQRASAGLVISEGTQPSFGGQGYARTPGIHTPEQTAAWRPITNAVHAGGAVFFCQLMHAGRVAHPLNRRTPKAPVAPSAIAADAKVWTDDGLLACAMPRALSADGIRDVIDEYAHATRSALQAGFDGVELHGMSGYLPMQFLSSNSNCRDDRYGGSVVNRIRFVLEVMEAMINAAGDASRIGLRVAPGFRFNDMADADPEQTYTELATAVNQLGIGYMHVARGRDTLYEALPFDPVGLVRSRFHGTLIAAGNFDANSAEALLVAGGADLVAFGRHFLANPDLPRRIALGAPLNVADEATFYTPGPQGYTDYPALPLHT